MYLHCMLACTSSTCRLRKLHLVVCSSPVPAPDVFAGQYDQSDATRTWGCVAERETPKLQTELHLLDPHISSARLLEHRCSSRVFLSQCHYNVDAIHVHQGNHPGTSHTTICGTIHPSYSSSSSSPPPRPAAFHCPPYAFQLSLPLAFLFPLPHLPDYAKTEDNPQLHGRTSRITS